MKRCAMPNLETVKLDIVHFSGQGSTSSEITLEDDVGRRRPVTLIGNKTVGETGSYALELASN